MLFRLQPTGTIAQAVDDKVNGEVLELELVDDNNPGTYGVRAWVRRRATDSVTYVEFLIVGKLLHEVQAKDLAEVEFTCWPPTGGLR